MTRFEDYVCVVTGATRGIGRGIALGLGEVGAIVYITGRTAKPSGSKVGGSLEETAAEINSRGGVSHSVASCPYCVCFIH
ncbi:putative short chain dehydrogenase [Paragonimus heterotremus]|uniref:Putative short chain dehydrogenase n=1 Tax=Paragonimus heterotremus TaxID=100268 RepID=A0A8J4SXV0_9TREM|nr:putative short chain dehydrogenase [Paragonimus heterotremus]